MVICQACQTKSPVDSLFCRSCGTPLAADAITAAKNEVDRLVTEGKELLASGRKEEAKVMADEIIAQSPSLPAGYALRGEAFEAMGDLPAALDNFEKAAELDPQSPLDRIRITHLRHVISAGPVVNPTTQRRRAALAGLAATICVVSIGLAIGLSRSAGASSGKPQDLLAKNTANPETNSGLEFVPEKEMTGAGAGPQPTTAEVTSPEPTRPSDSSAVRSTNPGGRLPDPAASPSGLEPFPIGPISIKPSEGSGSKPAPSSDPDPAPVRQNPDNSATPPTKPQQKKSGGIIDIKPSQDSGTGDRNTGGASGPNLSRLARDKFLSGDFEGAAVAYEKLLSSGGDPGLTNQRLAQCYEKLGRKSEAKEAYRRAIAAFEAKGNQDALETCRQALKVLGG